MRIGICFDGMGRIGDMVKVAREAEAVGADSIWIAEHLCFRDGFTQAMAFLCATKGVRVVPVAISPYSRHPMIIAMSAATLDEIAPGRSVLLLGSGNPMALGEISIQVRAPLIVLSEAMLVVRELLKGDFVHFEGKKFSIRDAKLGFSPRTPIPIHLAAIGEKMLMLGGNLADGVCLSGGCSPSYMKWAIDAVGEGAKAAGRDRKEIEISGFIITSASNDERKAVEASKLMLAYIFRSDYQDANLRISGVAIDKEAVQEACSKRDWDGAKKHISDDLVELFTASGTARRCSKKIEDFIAAGIDTPVLLPPSGAVDWEEILKIVKTISQTQYPNNS